MSLVEAFLRFFSRIMSRPRKSRRPLDHHTKAIYSQKGKGASVVSHAVGTLSGV
jgi:hypothetical protein